MALFGLIKEKETSVLGIDIGSSAIKVVQIKKHNGQAVLETYGELVLGPYGNAIIGQAVSLPPDKLAQALTDLMHEKEVNVTTNKCGISIPFSSSLMTVMEMPEVARKQLEAMIPIEARKYIPIPISEVQLDWSLIPKEQIRPEAALADSISDKQRLKTVNVLVVAIPNDVISKYQTIVQKSALDAAFFEIELFSTMRAVVDEALKPVMIMDMGAATTKLYIVERGVVKESHTINRGAQDITKNISQALNVPMDKAEIMKREHGADGTDKQLTEAINLSLDYIFAEANQVILAFEKKYNSAVAKVILVGGGSALSGFADIAKINFKTEVVAGDPFSKVSAPAFLADVLRKTGPEFAVAIGLALRRLAEEE